MTSKLGESGFWGIILLYLGLDHKFLNKVSSMKKTFSKCYKLLHMWLQDLQKQWQMVVIIKTKKKKNYSCICRADFPESEKYWSLRHVWLCNPIDCSPRGFPVHGILQARILEWITIPFSRGSSWPKNGIQGLLHCRQFTVWATMEAQIVLKGLTICEALVGSSSVQFSHSVVSDSLWPHGLQHARPPCPSPTPGVYPNSCPLSWWCHPTISSSIVPFTSCPQSFPASGSFQMSQFFLSGAQGIGVSAPESVLPMNTQDWSPLGWTGWISMQSKGLSRVFSNTTVQKHQFFGAQLSSQSNSHIHTWPMERP